MLSLTEITKDISQWPTKTETNNTKSSKCSYITKSNKTFAYINTELSISLKR